MNKNLLDKASVFALKELVQYAEGSIVSREIYKNDSGTITLFAFAEEQGLSEHTAPFDAVVQLLDGKAEFIIGGKAQQLREGEIIIMPANISHAVKSQGNFKMLLTMIKQA